MVCNCFWFHLRTFLSPFCLLTSAFPIPPSLASFCFIFEIASAWTCLSLSAILCAWNSGSRWRCAPTGVPYPRTGHSNISGLHTHTHARTRSLKHSQTRLLPCLVCKPFMAANTDAWLITPPPPSLHLCPCSCSVHVFSPAPSMRAASRLSAGWLQWQASRAGVQNEVEERSAWETAAAICSSTSPFAFP